MKIYLNQYFIPLLFFIFLSRQGCSQYILAGSYDTSDIYTDVSPDSLLTGFLNHASSYNENFEFDINHDGTNDFIFYNQGVWSNAGSSSYISLNSLHSNAKILSRYDTVQGFSMATFPATSPFYRNIVEIINLNDTINVNHYYSPLTFNTNNIQYIGEYHSGGHEGPNIFEWVNIGDKYIGVQLLKNQDTLFGWIRISISRTNAIFYTTIKDYACNKSYSIQIDTTSNPTDSLVFPNCCISYPNPASQIIKFSLPIGGDWNCKLYNHLGQLVKEEKYLLITGFDIFPLLSGIYYAELTFNSYKLRYRFVKQNQ